MNLYVNAERVQKLNTHRLSSTSQFRLLPFRGWWPPSTPNSKVTTLVTRGWSGALNHQQIVALKHAVAINGSYIVQNPEYWMKSVFKLGWSSSNLGSCQLLSPDHFLATLQYYSSSIDKWQEQKRLQDDPSVSFDIIVTSQLNGAGNMAWMDGVHALVHSLTSNRKKPQTAYLLVTGVSPLANDDLIISYAEKYCFQMSCGHLPNVYIVFATGREFEPTLSGAYNNVIHSSKATHVLFVHSSSFPTAGYSDRLVESCLKLNASVASSLGIYPDETVQYAGYNMEQLVTVHGSLYFPFSKYHGSPALYPPVPVVSEIDFFNEASTIFRLENLKRISGFTLNDFIFGHLDVGMRLCRNGNNLCLLIPESVVLRVESYSPIQQKDIYQPDLIQFNQLWAESFNRKKSNKAFFVWYHAECNLPAVLTPLERNAPFQFSVHTRGYQHCSAEHQLSSIGLQSVDLIQRTNYFDKISAESLTIIIHDREYHTLPEYIETRSKSNQVLIGRYHMQYQDHMLKRQYAGYIPEELVAQCNYDLDELWVYTEHEKESYISAGVDSAKIRIVPDSVDSGLFFALIDEGGLPSDKFWMFDGSEIGVGEKNFLFSGILEDVSVWHGVVDAFLEIYKESKNVKLIFQMRDLSGWINGERTFSELSAYILKTHEKNGAPGILIIDRELTAGQHRDLYRYSHCVVLPSWSSQLPWFLTIPQIMSLQLPIIDTSNVISESFISEANAFIIPSNNKNLRESLPYSEVSLKLLGKYMNICIDNTKLAEEKSLMARNKVISLFNAENIAMDIRHIFDSIAGNFSQKSAAVLQEFNPSPITYPVIHDSASCSPSTTHSIQRFNQTDPINILVITSYPPTRCGIAEFSKSLMNYLSATSKANNVFFHVMAMVPDSYTAANNPQRLVDNQNSNVQIAGVIRSQNYADYIKAASYINENIDIVSLQHEFGLFGGTDGTYILCMIKSTNKPVITTFHTVHNFLDMKHHYILRQIYMNSAANIVMGHISDIFMQSVHAVGEPKKLKLIPHGATPYKSLDNLLLKEKQGWKNNFVILSMGLHKPKKGFDIMISAMPAVLKKVPNAIFVIVGHGHPTCKDCPEYTNQMRVKAASYNLLDSKILFLEKYFDKAELDELVQTCDLYVSLYTANEITSSGTVSSAISAGRAVLATPYIYAREALSHGRGIIIPFGSVEQTAQAVIKVALDPMYRVQLQKKAFQYAQETFIWPIVARKYMNLFNEVLRSNELQLFEKQ